MNILVGLLSGMLVLSPATVTDIYNNHVQVETSDGECYEFYGKFSVGNKLEVVIDTNGTKDVTDDKIIYVY